MTDFKQWHLKVVTWPNLLWSTEMNPHSHWQASERMPQPLSVLFGNPNYGLGCDIPAFANWCVFWSHSPVPNVLQSRTNDQPPGSSVTIHTLKSKSFLGCAFYLLDKTQRMLVNTKKLSVHASEVAGLLDMYCLVPRKDQHSLFSGH